MRYSLEPHSYVDTNLVGFVNILEGCRHNGVEHLVYASSSSVYGSNTEMPLSVHHNVDHPVSLYAASKKPNELMAHTYSHLFLSADDRSALLHRVRSVGSPGHGAVHVHAQILAGKPIDVFNYGKHRRDLTYIDDIVEGVVRILDRIPAPNPEWKSDAPDSATSNAPYKLYNIGVRA